MNSILIIDEDHLAIVDLDLNMFYAMTRSSWIKFYIGLRGYTMF